MTGATIFPQEKFGVQQIMAVTEYKSVDSLVQYHRISYNEKMAMGNVLGAALDAEVMLQSAFVPSTTSSVPSTRLEPTVVDVNINHPNIEPDSAVDVPSQPNFELNLDWSLEENAQFIPT